VRKKLEFFTNLDYLLMLRKKGKNMKFKASLRILEKANSNSLPYVSTLREKH